MDAKTGSVTAFGQLIHHYEAKVFRVAQSIARTREDAEEIAQNVFVNAFESLSRFRGDSRSYAWLVRITINEAVMKVRRRRLNVVSIDDWVDTVNGAFVRELKDRRPTLEEHCSHEELRSILSTTIHQHWPAYRKVIQLREVEGFSTQETAQARNLSLTAVKSRLRRARVALRSSLDKHTRSVSAIHNQRSFGGAIP